MKTVHYVTGNRDKFREVQYILAEYDLVQVDLDIDEIQSFDIYEIARKKAQSAYCQVGKPVIVEDVGFYIDAIGGFPGPFIKFVEQTMGEAGTIELLGGRSNRLAHIKVVVVYYDGSEFITAESETKGNLTWEVREGEGFGFDHTFIPEWSDLTYSEMGLEKKSENSHRTRALNSLMKKLSKA